MRNIWMSCTWPLIVWPGLSTVSINAFYWSCLREFAQSLDNNRNLSSKEGEPVCLSLYKNPMLQGSEYSLMVCAHIVYESWKRVRRGFVWRNWACYDCPKSCTCTLTQQSQVTYLIEATYRMGSPVWKRWCRCPWPMSEARSCICATESMQQTIQYTCWIHSNDYGLWKDGENSLGPGMYHAHVLKCAVFLDKRSDLEHRPSRMTHAAQRYLQSFSDACLQVDSKLSTSTSAMPWLQQILHAVQVLHQMFCRVDEALPSFRELKALAFFFSSYQPWWVNAGPQK